MATYVSSIYPELFAISQPVYDLIMLTENHIVNENTLSSAIIRADLHGLADPVSTFWNFTKIAEESINLYNIDEYTFAKNSAIFMSSLYARMETNKLVNAKFADFYIDVQRGIQTTIELSKLLRGL